MDQLETLVLCKLTQQFENIQRVAATTDLKLLSVHDRNNVLLILSIKTHSNVLSLSNIRSFAWQEDNYYLNEYRLLAIDKHNETCYYVIKTAPTGGEKLHLEIKSVTKWHLKESLKNFHELARQLDDVPTYEILHFEAKEAVFLFDKKIVASFFLSPYDDPQIMSISDISDSGISYKKVILTKDMLFGLDSTGTKLYIYSFATNTKIFEAELSDCSIKHLDAIVANDFSINLNLDLIIFITDNHRMYSMPLNLSDINAPASSFTSRTVTAFTKQLPSVKRVDSLRKCSISSGYVQRIYFTCNTSDLNLEKILFLENKLFFLYQSHEESIIGIHLLDSDEPTICKRLLHPAYFINCLPEAISSPLLLFFDNKISLLKYDIDQNKLVNELMMYPCSSTVENLASLNNWSSIQMDIEVLKSGLNNRKVYTVELYLKTLFDGFSQTWSAATSLKWFEKIQNECENWEHILNLVLLNVKLNLSENITYQYAEQLLHIVINIVMQIIELIWEKAAHEVFFSSSDKDALLTKFTHLLLQMRTLLKDQEISSPKPFCEIKPLISDLKLKSEASDYWTKWENVLPEDIIQEAILTGTVPLAQSYFYCCSDDGDPSFQQFEQAAENLVIYFLRQDLISEALTVLLNMGVDINSELLKIFKFTPERDVRFVLLNELQERNLLGEADLKLLKFVSLIEKLYPCTSFEHARALLDEKNATSVNDMCCAVPCSENKLSVGDLIISNQDNSESGAYCRIVLDWVASWDDDVRSRILAPHFLKNSPVLDYFSKEGISIEVNPMSLWCYLLENGSLPFLTNWIETWLNSEKQAECSSIFKNWQISEDMINAIPERATLYIAEILLNNLARHGVFCEEELEDISLFLMRISRSQCDINDLQVFSSSKASITFSDLMHRLVHYCLKHNLVRLLYSLLSSNYKKFSVWPSCSLCDVPVLNLTKTFYVWSLNRKDCQLAYDAAAGTAQYLFNLKSAAPTDLMLGLPLPLCLSIFLCKSQPLAQTINEAFKHSGVPEHSLKEKFLTYPLLYNALFKNSAEQSHPDVTVYELLKGNTIFDTTQLFGWQPSNTLRSEDSLNELPNFSLKSLSEQYGLKKQLNYLYYLLQRRPNYAYLKYIQEEVSSSSVLSLTRIKSACSDVAEFALQNYRNPQVSLSCVLFTELAGQDSLPLRACLIAANILHKSRISSSDVQYEKSFPEIWKMFKVAGLSKDAASNLVKELEQVAVKSWDTSNENSDSLVQEICLWMPAMILSHLYGVEIGNLFLNECAKKNNWLKFLVFAQIFQLPKDQVLRSASKFSDPCLYYHIYHALQRKTVAQSASIESKATPITKPLPRDMRSSLYSRIGVLKETATDLRQSTELEDDRCSISSNDTMTSTSSSEADTGSFVLKDLFSQLLLAHSSSVPWESLLHTSLEIRNPILGVLAASYPGSPLESCFYVWLYTALCQDEDCKKHIESHFHDKVDSLSTDDIESLMLFAVRKKKILLLWQGVQFFLPTTPLMPLMEFLKDFLIFKKFNSSVETFQNHLWDYPRKSQSPSVIHSALWVENVSVSIIKESVISCSTSYERLILLRHFSHTRLEKSFSKEVTVPPFIKVCHMLQYSAEIDEDIDIQTFFLPEYDMNYKSTCWLVVQKLLQLQQSHEAEMFATAARLPLEDLFLLQMNQTVNEARKNANWSKLSYRIDFWKPVLNKLNSTIIPIQAAVEFLENHCEISDMYGEKYFLMKFIINLLSMPSSRSGMPESKAYNLENLQRKMWYWCIKAQVRKEIVSEIFDVASVDEFDFEVVPHTLSQYKNCPLESIEEKEALRFIINQLLSKKDLKKAFELSSIFEFKSQDLEIIQTCLQLAKGECNVASVNMSIPDCSSEVPSSRFIRSLMLWLSSNPPAIPAARKDVILCIEALSRKCEIAVSICHQILVDFIAATVLKRNYIDIAKEKDMLNTLKQILTRKLNDEHLLAKCFIVVQDLPDRVVAVFLSEEIWRSMEISLVMDMVLVPEEQRAFSEGLIYDPLRSEESFQLIVKLCQDPSILGKMLMDLYATEISELSSKSPDKTFLSIVELCICAHECFTAACNMEGISQILHNCQHLITLLEEAKQFKIMVHLLIGLGRYSEMSYVFDILKTHNELSLSILFVKRTENANNLKLALLDYLKKLPPSESDLYFCTLANTFGMHREKAEILEMSVQKQLSQLCKKNLDIDMKEDLEIAMNNLVDAARSYVKADCLHQAQNCTRLAQLLALQIYFLPSGIWIVGLDDTSVSRFITEHDNFSQSFIVAEHYGNHQLWSQAILNNTVLRGDREYLHNFRAQFGLSTSLISEVVRRYQKLEQKLENSMKHVQFLLNLCPNIKVKYSLALELGFHDMASELLMGEGAPYLQDLIANNAIRKS